MNKLITKYISKIKSPKVLVVIGLCGIVLIYLSTLTGGTAKKSEKQPVQLAAEDYRDRLERDLCEMVSDITGNDDVTVVVTLESGIKYSYADTTSANESSKTEGGETSGSSESSRSFITVKTADGGEQALLVTETMPEVRGVAVVCAGGDDELLNEKIKNAVMAALNITSKRVYIAGGSTHEKG